jgi:hypothetical protein
VQGSALGLGVAIGLVVSGALASAEAVAATVSLDHGVLSYRADPGERNAPTVSVLRSAGEPLVEVDDAPHVRLIAGTGCMVAPDADGGEAVRCPRTPGAALPRVRAVLGDGADSATVKRLLGRVAGGPGRDRLSGAGHLHGGPGGDSLTLTRGSLRDAHGGPGDDGLQVADGVKSGAVLAGGRGDDELNGGRGRDLLRGGMGDDRFYDPGDGGPGDVYRLGPGRDEATSYDGADTIFARDGEYDYIHCGFARETVFLDGLDFYDQEVEPCDRVRRRGAPRVLPDTAVAYLEYDFGQDAGPNQLEVAIMCPHDLRPCRGMFTVSSRQGVVVEETFHFATGGPVYDYFRMPKPTLRRLARWARIVVVSYDRAGGVHRHSIAGPNVVVINDPEVY